jgi:transposase
MCKVNCARLDGHPIAQAALDFGLSRPTIYEAQQKLRQAGVEGLLPQKRGPKKARKLTPDVRRYVEELVGSEPDLQTAVLVQRVQTRFGIVLHPRTVEKAVRKKGRHRP